VPGPLELIEKLCVLMAPPRFHLLRFHGVLAPHAQLRSDVVPRSSRDAALGGRGATPFASRVPEPSLVRSWQTLLGGPDAAGVRGRRSAVQPLRRRRRSVAVYPGRQRRRELLDRLWLSGAPRPPAAPGIL
jgi:hypothetical protein